MVQAIWVMLAFCQRGGWGRSGVGGRQGVDIVVREVGGRSGVPVTATRGGWKLYAVLAAVALMRSMIGAHWWPLTLLSARWEELSIAARSNC